MDYILRCNMRIDTESKKNTFRDFLLSNLSSQYEQGNLATWDLTVNGIVVPSEDSESYNASG